MEPDRELLLRAARSRDPRFDGRIFIGVRTTGIYCRPICPARPPRPENIRFYGCAAAAEKAGLRACRRCRPDTAPGSPAWIGPPATVGRALRLIADGELDRASVATLAARLGIGPRHLHRLFVAHLGAAPVEVAQTRRVHFARRLVDATDLPIARIAAASGFGSVRRFHFAFRRAFALAPAEARRRRGPARRVPLVLHLALRPPFDWASAAGYLAARAIPGVEIAGPSWYRRSVRAGGETFVITVTPDAAGRHLRLAVPTDPAAGLLGLVERVRAQFDLDAEPRAIAEHLGRDSLLAPLVRARPGLRVTGAFDRFELAVRAVLGQQVSVAAATTMSGRLVQEFGEPLRSPDAEDPSHAFPRPERLAGARLERIGLTGARAGAIRALAGAVARDETLLARAASLEEAVERLRALPGIGPWTASYIALRALGEPDAFPQGDLGLQRASGLDERRLLERAERWRPWRGYAASHLWRSLAATAGPRRLHPAPHRYRRTS